MKYGFGIVGLGLVADFHAMAIKAMKNGKLVACYSRSKEKAKSFGKKYDCKSYSSIKDFVLHTGLDIVTICTPSGFHLEPSLIAIEAGKNLIVEKPLEITLDRCDRIIEACERKKVKLAVIFQSRFYDIVRIVKDTIRTNRFGKLVLGDAYIKWYRNQEYYNKNSWRGTLKFNGGALMNQSIHALDLLQWFMGPVECVQAFTGIIGHKGIEVEDNAVAILKFTNGAFGVIEASTSVFPGFSKRIEISGTKGSVIIEEQNLKVWEFSEKKDEDREIRKKFLKKTEIDSGASNPSTIDFRWHQKQFEDMVEVLKTRRKPFVDGYEARKSIEIILAIYKSAQEGKKIKLPL